MKSGCDSICLRKTSRGTELSSARPGGRAGVVVEGMSCVSVIAEGLMFGRIGGRNFGSVVSGRLINLETQ